MSCGVRYQFSIIDTPRTAKLMEEDVELIGTPHDAEEQGPADIRRSQTDEFVNPAPTTPRGRQRSTRR